MKSTYLYAPVPTGLRFAGASRELAPLNCSKTCLGMIWPVGPQSAVYGNGWGRLNVTLTVLASTFSIFVTFGKAPEVTAAVAGSVAYSQLKTTSSAVNGLPSCHWTFFLSFQVTDVPSLAIPPFWTVGISAARFAMRFPSGSKEARGS